MRYDYWQSDREAATVLENGMKVRTADRAAAFDLQMWMPKAQKPFVNYTFRSAEARADYIRRAVENFDAHQQRKAERRRQRSEGDASLADPGAIFCYSWGYDQANVDYFQVIERCGLMVTVARIGQEVVRGSEGFMSERVRPRVDGFLYRCADCHDGEHALCHSQVPDEAKERFGCSCRQYRPTRIVQNKRLYFSNGEPHLSFEHGVGSLVRVVRFGNADALVLGESYQSHYA